MEGMDTIESTDMEEIHAPSAPQSKPQSATKRPMSKKSAEKRIKSAKKPKLPKQEAKNAVKKGAKKKEEGEALSQAEIDERYPLLNNKDLVQQFMKVSLTNNQKGRIRQTLKDQLQGTTENILPDIIHSKITTILKGNPVLSDSDLRKIRILYNMLQTATQNVRKVKEKKKPEEKEGKEKQKKRGDKRYVVFVGNLPPGIGKDKITEHFAEISHNIKDIRVPPPSGAGGGAGVEGGGGGGVGVGGGAGKAAIAYLELRDEPSYELALSKHHSMLANKRINVLYTTQKNGKVTAAQAKSKSAKLSALRVSGTLLGSAPAARKRSHRRNKARAAQRAQAAE